MYLQYGERSPQSISDQASRGGGKEREEEEEEIREGKKTYMSNARSMQYFQNPPHFFQQQNTITLAPSNIFLFHQRLECLALNIFQKLKR
jgi:hypothetical protein